MTAPKKEAAISYTAAEYEATKTGSPFRTEVEAYTIFQLVGDPTGLTGVDVGCGDGLYSRTLADLGAKHIVGVDCVPEFIEMARAKNVGYEGRIEYAEAFVQDLNGRRTRDLVLGSYVLSYPRNAEEAVAYCRGIASLLKPGGRFVGFNNNPFDISPGERFASYGFRKTVQSTVEGSEVVYRVDGMTDPIVNYYLQPMTYEAAFREAGFAQFRWERVQLNPECAGDPYWEEFFREEPPFIAMVAVK
ncbi:MAG: class I SAM-dependent methyltransferase [bacterium]|nr:class I SAM-dependent methyltransferase [bacterium]